MIEQTWKWIADVGEYHNVNPVVFGVLYLVSIPPYIFSMGWVVRNYRNDKSLKVPILSTLFWFILPAMYVLITGEEVAWYVYILIAIMLVYGTYSVIKRTKKKIEKIK